MINFAFNLTLLHLHQHYDAHTIEWRKHRITRSTPDISFYRCLSLVQHFYARWSYPIGNGDEEEEEATIAV